MTCCYSECCNDVTRSNIVIKGQATELKHVSKNKVNYTLLIIYLLKATPLLLAFVNYDTCRVMYYIHVACGLPITCFGVTSGARDYLHTTLMKYLTLIH